MSLLFMKELSTGMAPTKDSWFSHIAITKGTSEWLEKVDDDYYNTLG